jgi:hypothetical protein
VKPIQQILRVPVSVTLIGWIYGRMMYAVEIASNAMTYIPGFITIVSGLQETLRSLLHHTERL